MMLNQLGAQLARDGMAVYSSVMSDWARNSVRKNKELALLIKHNETKNMRTVILIDEVNSDMKDINWSMLLRNHRDLIVIGAGIPVLGSTQSPAFMVKYVPRDFYLTEDNNFQSEVVQPWCDVYNFVSQQHQELAAEICKQILAFTGGHWFSFLMICNHMFQTSIFDEHCKNPYSYLTSQVFFDSDTALKVYHRCFMTDKNDHVIIENILKGEPVNRTDIKHLENCGFWDEENKWFISPLLTWISYNHIRYTPGSPRKCSLKPLEMITSIIVAGLEAMQHNDFKETSISNDKWRMENSIGGLWGFHVKEAFPAIFVCPQVRADSRKPNMPYPSIDFTFNSTVDLAIELSLNGYDINGKIEKISENGVYREWKDRSAILNFQLKKCNVKKLSTHYKVFHFVNDENALYHKGKIIALNLLRHTSKRLYTEMISKSSAKIHEWIKTLKTTCQPKSVGTVRFSEETREIDSRDFCDSYEELLYDQNQATFDEDLQLAIKGRLKLQFCLVLRCHLCVITVSLLFSLFEGLLHW